MFNVKQVKLNVLTRSESGIWIQLRNTGNGCGRRGTHLHRTLPIARWCPRA